MQSLLTQIQSAEITCQELHSWLLTLFDSVPQDLWLERHILIIVHLSIILRCSEDPLFIPFHLYALFCENFTFQIFYNVCNTIQVQGLEIFVSKLPVLLVGILSPV